MNVDVDPLHWLFTAELQIGDQAILWREVLGNAFGLASALGGMLVVLYAIGTAAFWWLFGVIGSYGRLTEAWILTGSILATYGMARGWVEFWLLWIAVDAVGVPTLIDAGFYPSAALYAFYGAFCVAGFVTWRRVERTPVEPAEPELVEA